MPKDEKSNTTTGALTRFEPGGDLGPVEDRNEYDQHLKSLPAGEKELAEESARFADLCQYFERQRMDVPVEILDQLGRASRLAVPERIEAMKKLNQRLMEYLNHVGNDQFIRQ
ncbi:MAG: hypothetical protein WCG81_08665 [Candidatus Angelobacter sp.]